jgi:hypothetical protein
LSDKAKANLAAAVTFVEKLIRDGLDKAAISFAAN